MSDENGNLSSALEYLERGWSIIPINPTGTKKPLIEWREFQGRFPTEEEVRDWWGRWPFAIPAILTGPLSGIYIVDCDTDDAMANAEADGVNVRTPVQVKTRRGRHLYYAHPHDGRHRGPHSSAFGSSDPNFHWPKGRGYDWRGEGSYALLPATFSPYTWEMQPGADFDDLPVWEDLVPEPGLAPEAQIETDPLDLDLSSAKVPSAEAHLSEWEKAERLAASFRGGKIPTGQSNGRNERVMRYASELIRAGHWSDLEPKLNEFMDTFFIDRLGPREVRATIRSMQLAERRNHPENFDASGQWTGGNRASHLAGLPPAAGVTNPGTPAPATAPQLASQQAQLATPLIFMKDADELERQAKARGILIDPFLPSGGAIIQVYGYTGHGKSTFVQHLFGAACAADTTRGPADVGPFEVHRQPRVLYLNFEEGRRTVANRLQELKALYGDTKDRLAIWAPFLEPDGTAPTMRDNDFLARLTGMIRSYKPDVVVVDTVRTGWPGLEENKAEAWVAVNTLALKLRNAGIAFVMIHHGNKPGDGGDVGAEAGSTAQLNNVEVQLRVARVYQAEAEARLHSAVCAGNLNPTDFCLPPGYIVWDWLESDVLRPNEKISWLFEVRRRKVRELDYSFAPAYLVGFAVDIATGKRRMISTLGPRQSARRAYTQFGTATRIIADTLGIPLPIIDEWVA